MPTGYTPRYSDRSPCSLPPPHVVVIVVAFVVVVVVLSRQRAKADNKYGEHSGIQALSQHSFSPSPSLFSPPPHVVVIVVVAFVTVAWVVVTVVVIGSASHAAEDGASDGVKASSAATVGNARPLSVMVRLRTRATTSSVIGTF